MSTLTVPHTPTLVQAPNTLPPPYVIEEELASDRMVLNMGPHHPSTHGVLRLIVTCDGEVVEKAVPDLGYLHRAIEKISENVSWKQVMPYTDRVDYLCAMNSNFAYALGIEKLAGIQVPKRAQYLRVIMAELNRITSHLLCLGAMAMDLGAYTPFLLAIAQREVVNDLFEATCGARLTYNYFRIGGLAWDIPAGWEKACHAFLTEFVPRFDDFNELITGNTIFINRCRDVGVISREEAISYGLVGPNLRGSGVKFDVRRDEPYSSYEDFEFDVPIGVGYPGTVGDAYARYMVRVKEVYESVKIIRQALKNLPSGDVLAKVPGSLKPPAGDVYVRSENPRGETGYYLMSDGTNVAVRVKIRTGSFTAMSIFEKVSKGHLIADLVALIGSLDIVIPEVDR
ncbi:MAG: NADH-quinone oxidoreductase subunit D [Planctomycetes bacterium]|nr:NADH-quinone oxidoreductase subunit D [Planctomycetota bacterium]